MEDLPDFTLETDAQGGQTLALSGRLLVTTIGELDEGMRGLDGPIARINLAEVAEIDTVGAWVVWRMARDHKAEIDQASEQASRLIAAVKGSKGTGGSAAPRFGLANRVAEAVGEQVVRLAQDTVAMLSFLGTLIVATGGILRNPSRFRGKALVHQLELVGVDSLAIIGLMSFLIGIVIAQQGAVQLEQFGAQVFTINLTGRLSMRELGILMTAIMVAGRSGSAFAAQIGTMKLTEEIDAMRTIGVSPMEALVLPRVLAAMLMMPLLGFYSAVIAIIGGAVLSQFTLDIPFFSFLSRIQEVVPLRDLWISLLKAPVFGLIIALTGCYQGMQVSGNSEEVGSRTTQAVVQAIFAVIVLDAFFAIFFSEIGWN